MTVYTIISSVILAPLQVTYKKQQAAWATTQRLIRQLIPLISSWPVLHDEGGTRVASADGLLSLGKTSGFHSHRIRRGKLGEEMTGLNYITHRSCIASLSSILSPKFELLVVSLTFE